jgi:hypothetical protein
VGTWSTYVKDNPSVLAVTPAVEEKAMAELVKQQKNEALGVRASNRAVTVESIAGMGRVADAVSFVHVVGRGTDLPSGNTAVADSHPEHPRWAHRMGCHYKEPCERHILCVVGWDRGHAGVH